VRRCLVLALAIGAATGYALAKTPARTPELLATGKAAYEGSAAGCFACHGLTGEGNGPVAFAIKPPPRNFVVDDFKGGDKVENVFTTITLGLPGTKMVGYPQLPEADRWALAYYVLAFRAPRK
jgi:high-affinity iron transporter